MTEQDKGNVWLIGIAVVSIFVVFAAFGPIPTLVLLAVAGALLLSAVSRRR